MKCPVYNRGACLSSVFNLKDKFKRAGRPASFFFSTSFFHGKETPGPGVRRNGRRAPAARLITTGFGGTPDMRVSNRITETTKGSRSIPHRNRLKTGKRRSRPAEIRRPCRRKGPEKRSRNAPKGPGGRGPGARRGAVKTVGIERWERFSGMPADRTTDTRGSDRTTEIRRIRGDIRSESAEDRRIRNIQGVETPKARKREGPTTNTTVRGDIPVGTRRRVNEKEEQNIPKL